MVFICQSLNYFNSIVFNVAQYSIHGAHCNVRVDIWWFLKMEDPKSRIGFNTNKWFNDLDDLGGHLLNHMSSLIAYNVF